MAARKKTKKTKDDDPVSKASRHPSRLMEAGGVERFERDAVREVREYWLGVCERWQAELDASDLPSRRRAELQAQRLRRQLAIKAPKKPPDLERIREQTRERVRRYRERQKKG